jgi:RNA polymerase sigma-70 factor (ECF subfamily)
MDDRATERDRAERRARFDAEAMAQLDALYSFALKLTRGRDDAEDLVSDTLLRAFQRWEQYRLGTNIRAWLFTILYHAFVSRKRRIDAREVQPLEDEDGREIFEPVGEAAARQFARQRVGDRGFDQRALVHGESSGLPQHERAVVGEGDRDAEVERERCVLGGEGHGAARAQALGAVGLHVIDGHRADGAELARLLLRERPELGAVHALQDRVEAPAVVFGADEEVRHTVTPSSSSTNRLKR